MLKVEEKIDILQLTLSMIERLFNICRKDDSIYNFSIDEFYIALSISKEGNQEYTIIVNTSQICNHEDLDYHLREVLDTLMFKLKPTYVSYCSEAYNDIYFRLLSSFKSEEINLIKSSEYSLNKREYDRYLGYSSLKYFKNGEYLSKNMILEGKTFMVFKLL